LSSWRTKRRKLVGLEGRIYLEERIEGKVGFSDEYMMTFL
jgi:hypothetical protein